MISLIASRRATLLRGLLMAAFGCSAAAAQAPTVRAPARSHQTVAALDEDNASEGRTTYLLREGSQLVKQLGTFQSAGDRIAFHPSENGQELRVLENLALERIAQVRLETSSQRQWSVSGTVTEYQGRNHLLITRAILQSRHSPSVPAAPIRRAEE